jgi:hypothetical protein
MVFFLNALSCAIMQIHAIIVCYISCLLHGYSAQKCPSVPVVHMDNIPPNSQRPRSFHQDFEREVFAVVFSVRRIIAVAHLDDQF